MSVYAASDFHGYLSLYEQIRDFLKPEDKVIFLGDAVDRGLKSWATMKAIASDPQWTYLCGNHEHMLAGAMCEYLDDNRLVEFIKHYHNSIQALSVYNGGFRTLESWKEEGANPDWITFLMKLPLVETYENSSGHQICLTHAGYTPESMLKTPTAFELLWNRDHFYDPWPDGFDNLIIVHGHTPVPHLHHQWKPNDGSVWYADTHKIDIDQGTYVSGQAVLLDLDTFDEHIFYKTEEEE